MATRLRLVGWVLLAAVACLATARWTGAGPAPLPPFHCYEVDRMGPAGPLAVFLNGVNGLFGGAQVNIRRLKRLCNPAQFFADKDVVVPRGRLDELHLAGYEIRNPQPPFQRIDDVTVNDQFGTHIVDLIRPALLLLPTAKDEDMPPPGIPVGDHYLCFRIRTAPVRASLLVDDQFGTVEGDIKRAMWFCAVVEKNKEPVIDPSQHLMCYQFRARPRRPDVDSVFINNQFGQQEIDVTRSREICVPATIGGPTPTPTSTPEGCGGDAVCGGACPAGETCVQVPKEGCECVDEDFGCRPLDVGTGGGPVCGGLCPSVFEDCVPTDSGCDCRVPPTPTPVETATPTPTETPTETPTPTATATPQPCTLIGFPPSAVCGGDCPIGQQCLAHFLGACECVLPADACGALNLGTGTIALCGGACPSPTDTCAFVIGSGGDNCTCVED
jgi:hypothetical protein